jgi:hypothetical protein
MTSREHYLAAESLLAKANNLGDLSSSTARALIALAQVHATLAEVATTYYPDDYVPYPKEDVRQPHGRYL